MRAADFEVQCTVGKLIEARLTWLESRADVERMQVSILEAFRTAGPQGVICADWRQAHVFAPEVGDALLELLKRGNREFKRSAVLVAAQEATFGLQVERLFRDAKNEARRSFRASEPMLAWLDEVLTPAEQQQARAFLSAR